RFLSSFGHRRLLLAGWAWLDLNQRPHPYQGCALTELSYRPGGRCRGLHHARRQAYAGLRKGVNRGPDLRVTRRSVQLPAFGERDLDPADDVGEQVVQEHDKDVDERP